MTDITALATSIADGVREIAEENRRLREGVESLLKENARLRQRVEALEKVVEVAKEIISAPNATYIYPAINKLRDALRALEEGKG